MSRIRLNQVSKRFGETWAVSALNLEIAQGEFVSIVGGSGCGKTTTLRMIAGFEVPTEGEIWLGDRMVNQVPVQDRGVGIVFQSYALFPTMTVGENCGFGLEMAGWSADARRSRVQKVLELVHLQDLPDRFPWQLSGGQQQRVALARALALAPGVLLLDEPLSALDARIRLSLRSEIRRLQQELNITTLYVTHDQEEALAIADRIVVMDRGRVMQVGTARQVYDTPSSSFVAGFVGVSNSLQGRWEGPGRIRVGGELWQVLGEGEAGASAQVCVRPERLRLTPEPDARASDTSNRLSGRIGVRTFLGSHWRVELLVGDLPVLVDVPREQEALLDKGALGGAVTVWCRPDDCAVFART